MRQFLEVFSFIVLGIFLLWFGYTLFFRVGGIPAWGGGGRFRKRGNAKPQPRGVGTPGESQTCPVCSAKLRPGELVNSSAFPSMNGGKDRFMHIKGCVYCLEGDRDRVCPVCGIILKDNEILISKLYERPGQRSHIHVIGCTHCKGPNSRK